MNKLAYAALTASTLFAAALSAQAAAVNGNFDVTVTLTSVCKATNATTPNLAFSYTAFSATNVIETAPVNLTFDCTRNVVPSAVTFDTVNGTATGGGVLAGLNYSLAVDAGTKTITGTNATATGGLGSADQYTYKVTGTIPAGQAGDKNAPTTHARYVVVTY